VLSNGGVEGQDEEREELAHTEHAAGAGEDLVDGLGCARGKRDMRERREGGGGRAMEARERGRVQVCDAARGGLAESAPAWDAQGGRASVCERDKGRKGVTKTVGCLAVARELIGEDLDYGGIGAEVDILRVQRGERTEHAYCGEPAGVGSLRKKRGSELLSIQKCTKVQCCRKGAT